MIEGIAITIPVEDRSRLKILLQSIARGRAAQMQFDGWVQTIALDNSIPSDMRITLTDEEVLFIPKDLDVGGMLPQLPGPSSMEKPSDTN